MSELSEMTPLAVPVRTVKGRDLEPRSPGTRDKILDAAERLIGIHGTEGFQLKDVAHAVGIRPPSIYAHFQGRDDITAAVALRLQERIATDLGLDRAGGSDPLAELVGLVRRLLRYMIENPAHLRLALRDFAQSGPSTTAAPALKFEIWGALPDAFQRLLRRGVADGKFREVRLEAARAQIVGAALSSLVWKGWDVDGRPNLPVPLSQIEQETEDLVVRLLGVS